MWESIDDLTFLEVILGHDEHIPTDSGTRPATWSRGRVDRALAIIAAQAGDRAASAAHLLRAAAQLDIGIRLLEHDFTITAAVCAAYLGTPQHACRLLAAVPMDVRSPSSLQLLLHARRLVREHLDRDTVAAIRSEMVNVDPVAVRREEIIRLRGSAAVDNRDQAESDAH